MSEEQKAQQREMNGRTREELARQGSDLAKPHGLVNVFYVFTEGAVQDLTRLLQEAGLEDVASSVVEEEDGTYWEVEGTTRQEPEISSLNTMTDLCVELADRVDGEYDGWYTQPE